MTSLIALADPVHAGLDAIGAPGGGPRAGRPTRRSFSAAYKERIVAEYDSAPVGEKGAILRRERVWETNIRRWRKSIALQGSEEMRKRSNTETVGDQRRIRELEKQVEALEGKIAKKDEELGKANSALEILGKGVAFLEALSSKNA